jgi:hypothetical protein
MPVPNHAEKKTVHGPYQKKDRLTQMMRIFSFIFRVSPAKGEPISYTFHRHTHTLILDYLFL